MTNNHSSLFLNPFSSDLKPANSVKYVRMYNLYLADKKMLAFNFRILVAYENWPNKQYIDLTGTIIKPENKKLKDTLKIIDDEMREYINKHYPMLDLKF